MRQENSALRQARKDKHLTQQELARLLGYKSTASVSNWEIGYCVPPLKTALQCAYILGKDVKEIFPNLLNPQVEETKYEN